MISTFQERAQALVRAAFPWARVLTEAERGGATFGAALDGDIRLRIYLMARTSRAEMFSNLNPPLFDPLEDDLDTEEWSDFQGWAAVARNIYEDIRNRTPATFLPPVACSLPVKFSSGVQMIQVAAGDLFWVKPHSGHVKFDGVQGWGVVTSLPLLHSAMRGGSTGSRPRRTMTPARQRTVVTGGANNPAPVGDIDVDVKW